MIETSLRRAILADPYDLTPRLVWADLRMQQGDPRGELVALACRLSASSTPAGERHALSARYDELLKAHTHEWLAAYGLTPEEARFGRGFISTLTLDADRLSAIDPSLFELEPIQYLTLRSSSNPLPLRSLLDALPSIDSLTLSGPFHADIAAEIATSRAAKHLRSLDLRRCAIGVAGLQHLVDTLAPSLEELVIENDTLSKAGAALLCRAPFAPSLLLLCLRSCSLLDTGTTLLASLPSPHLELLDLGYNAVEPAGAQALADSPLLHPVTALLLDGNLLEPEGLRHLLRSPCIPHLETLFLGHNDLGPEGLALLAQAPFRRLTHLSLGQDPIDPQSLAALQAAPWWPHLQHLD